MKILIVRTGPNKMNRNTYNFQELGLAKALTRKGNQCDVMCYGGNEKDHFEKISFDDGKTINILWIRGFGIFREGIYPTLGRYVKEYDILHVGGCVGVTSWWLNTRYQNKTVNYQGAYFCEHNKGDFKRAKIMDKILLPLYRKDKMIVAAKSILAAKYISKKGITDVTTIGVGLDLDNILREQEYLYEHDFIKLLKERKKNGKYLLYIGVLEERRDILFLIDVFKKVNEQIPECQLILIGRGKEEYVAACEDKINELGIADKVIRKEQLEQKYMKAVYEQADAFLLPTHYEIFGMVLLEAMYFGMPVFTTYNGGSSTLMNDENGIVLPEFNSDEWADKIVNVLNDDELMLKYSNAASKTIKERYTWDALADKFIELYNRRLGM